MKSKEKENLIFIRIYENEDINEKIKLSCKKHKVKTAIIISGIGQVKELTLGYFKQKGDYSPKYYKKAFEILNLSGNIIKQSDDYLLHLHITLGDQNKNAIGGHFIKGKVSVTAEIALLKTNISLKRRLDKKTGLQALNLE